jgi:hypothetical protein
MENIRQHPPQPDTNRAYDIAVISLGYDALVFLLDDHCYWNDRRTDRYHFALGYY